MNLCHRYAHLTRQRHEVACRQMTVCVLKQMQEFNQEFTLAWRLTQQGTHLVECRPIDLATFEVRPAFPSAPTRVQWRASGILYIGRHLFVTGQCKLACNIRR